ncbi:MAG: hypothetical protein WDO73_26460 [Ignavibacteriota bacterium]
MNFMNCFEVLNFSELGQPVNLFAIDFKDSMRNTQENRGELKNVMYQLRKQYRASCPGYGFVVDISPRLIAVPGAWKFPSAIETPEYTASLMRSFTAGAADSQGRTILSGILREAIKKRFKEDLGPELGPLWQDYDSFCQAPRADDGAEYLMCRRFGFAIRPLLGARIGLMCAVGTTMLDGKTFDEYYRDGNVAALAEMIEAKQGSRVNRRNRPVGVRVLHQSAGESAASRVLDFEDIDLVFADGRLTSDNQRGLGRQNVRCKPFSGSVIDVPLAELRLVLDTQITQEDHGETIIDPAERFLWAQKLRDFINGTELAGRSIQLAEAPLDAEEFGLTLVPPPAVRVRGAGGKEDVVEPPQHMNEQGLLKRARRRSDIIRKNGFLVQRPMDPLLAWPEKLGRERGLRMKRDVEEIWTRQGFEVSFGIVVYRDIGDIENAIMNGTYDILLAVLPEGSRAPQRPDDTHEKIKQRVQLPSQCIQHDRTLPARWATRTFEECEREDSRRALRIRQSYELCLGNLLVKHHCFPFAPRDAFHYNTHVGLDVGGVHNTNAMACIGHGFRRPLNELFFRPEAIPIEVQQKEPIPTECLYRGLLNLFELIYNRSHDAGLKPDFETTIFYRDGQLLGDGDSWNEREALARLHGELLHRGWVTDSSVWTAVEILKSAEGWRVFRSSSGLVVNPLVGECIFPFDDANTGLVCTTGAPYLRQGSARPMLIRIIDIHGRSSRDEVVRDLIWQADLCFTKPDMGMHLPWVLNVADTAALQMSRSYQITGITA